MSDQRVPPTPAPTPPVVPAPPVDPGRPTRPRRQVPDPAAERPRPSSTARNAADGAAAVEQALAVVAGLDVVERKVFNEATQTIEMETIPAADIAALIAEATALRWMLVARNRYSLWFESGGESYSLPNVEPPPA